MPTDAQILDNLKQAELDILVEFIKVCDTLNLKYYITYGTLIGAIRHKGFIPWDDDIDIYMTRDDFEKFKQNAAPLLPKNLFVQTYETDPEFIYSYMKIRNSNTTFIESTASHRNINHGIFIDIFPLDFYPKSKTKAFVLTLLCELIRRRVITEVYKLKNSNLNFLKKLFLYTQKIALRILFPSIKSTLKLQKKIGRSVNDSDKYVSYEDLNFTNKYIFSKNWFGEGIQTDFENIEVTVPKDYDSVLKNLYGDYMQLPPVDQQIPHHYSNIIDFNKSYKEYIK